MRREAGVLHLEGAVTMETVPGLVGDARDACRDGVACVDFAAVTEVDSAAIALALELERDAAAQQRVLAFRNMPPALHKLIELYGVAEHLGG